MWKLSDQTFRPAQPIPTKTKRKEVIILAGPPGCGKTEWRTRHFPDATIVSIDEIFNRPDRAFTQNEVRTAYRTLLEIYCYYLEYDGDEDQTLIVDAPNVAAKYRAPFIEAAFVHGWDVYIVVPPYSEQDLVRRSDPRMSAAAAERLYKVMDLQPGVYHITK